MHKVRILANALDEVPGHVKSVAQGYDVQLFIDDQPFRATGITLHAKGGGAPVLATVTFSVAKLEVEAEPETLFKFVEFGRRTPGYISKSELERITAGIKETYKVPEGYPDDRATG